MNTENEKAQSAGILGLNNSLYPIRTPRNENGLKRDIVDLVLNIAAPDDDCMLSDFLHALQFVLDKHKESRISELERRINTLEHHKNTDRCIREAFQHKVKELEAKCKKYEEALRYIETLFVTDSESINRKRLYKAVGKATEALKPE